MKATKVTALVVIVFLGFWYYWWNIAQPSSPAEPSSPDAHIVGKRSPINPENFTRQDTTDALAGFSAGSPLSPLMGMSGSPSSLAAVPEEMKPLILPAPGEVVEVRKGESGGKAFYSARYFSEIAMPENYTRLMREAAKGGLKVGRGVRNALASFMEADSQEYAVAVAQLTISEERTEVIVYVLKK
jgi:hypothetical protein